MRFQRRRTRDVSVDLTPLIDVVFLLLIFFMVSTTFIDEGRLKLELPEAAGEPAAEPPETLEIVVSANGEYAVDGRSLAEADIETLMDALRDVSEGDRSRPLVVTADAQAPHQAVVRAMDAAGRLGFAQLGIATRTPRAEAEQRTDERTDERTDQRAEEGAP